MRIASVSTVHRAHRCQRDEKGKNDIDDEKAVTSFRRECLFTGMYRWKFQLFAQCSCGPLRSASASILERDLAQILARGTTGWFLRESMQNIAAT
jgi:hypothetical protein